MLSGRVWRLEPILGSREAATGNDFAFLPQDWRNRVTVSNRLPAVGVPGQIELRVQRFSILVLISLGKSPRAADRDRGPADVGSDARAGAWPAWRASSQSCA